MNLFKRPFRMIVSALTEDCLPKQLALGVALGMVLGLLPKGNLLAVIAAVVFCAARINLGIGAASAVLFSAIAVWFDPITHVIGLKLLTTEWLQPAWTTLFNTPVIPWTRFNNTVVLGSLAMGLALFYPVYRLCIPAFERITPHVAAWLQKSAMARWMLRKKGSILDQAPQQEPAITQPAPAPVPVMEPAAAAASLDAQPVAATSAPLKPGACIIQTDPLSESAQVRELDHVPEKAAA